MRCPPSTGAGCDDDKYEVEVYLAVPSLLHQIDVPRDEERLLELEEVVKPPLLEQYHHRNTVVEAVVIIVVISNI